EGRSAMWLPGTDHASIATHGVVERMLRKEGKSRHQLGREKFLEVTWDWREKYGGIIIEQLKRLGCSCDWDRTTFTMDPAYTQRVLHVFVELYKRGHIYRGKRMVNWCPATLTALSDEEVIMKPVNGTMYRVRYELVGRPGTFIEVKTTRPETIPGDVAIAVHPDDPRYAALLGKKVRRPIGPAAELPIIADAAVDKEFGSGALKITPAHDRGPHDTVRAQGPDRGHRFLGDVVRAVSPRLSAGARACGAFPGRAGDVPRRDEHPGPGVQPGTEADRHERRPRARDGADAAVHAGQEYDLARRLQRRGRV